MAWAAAITPGRRQLPYFGGLGYPAHAWDQPGYGHSAIVEPYDLEQVCASLARLIGVARRANRWCWSDTAWAG